MSFHLPQSALFKIFQSLSVSYYFYTLSQNFFVWFHPPSFFPHFLTCPIHYSKVCPHYHMNSSCLLFIHVLSNILSLSWKDLPSFIFKLVFAKFQISKCSSIVFIMSSYPLVFIFVCVC